MAFDTTAAVLKEIAKHWIELGEAPSGQFLIEFVEACEAHHVTSLKIVEKLSSRWALDLSNAGRTDLSRTVEIAESTIRMLTNVAKPAATNAVHTFFSIIRDCSSMEPLAFLEKLRLSLSTRTGSVGPTPANDDNLSVDGYIAKLRETITNADAFAAVFTKLEKDRAMTQPRVVEIASAFAFKLAKSTTRKDALRRIKSQHETSAITGAKIRANDGRSAA
jgi:hypothetical protein